MKVRVSALGVARHRFFTAPGCLLPSPQAELPPQEKMTLAGKSGFLPYKATADLIRSALNGCVWHRGGRDSGARKSGRPHGATVFSLEIITFTHPW